MTLEETLKQLEAIGSEKMRAQNTKHGAGKISSALSAVTCGSWQIRYKLTTSLP